MNVSVASETTGRERKSSAVSFLGLSQYVNFPTGAAQVKMISL